MSAPDPRWLQFAEACYAVLLRSYPRALRERHGEEMRQAFRDRCREAATGRSSAWKLFSLELPDLVASVAASHYGEPRGSASPRALAGIALLGAFAILLLFQESLSPRLNDSAFALSARWQHWREERALLRDESQVRRFAETLAASTRVEDRALAAYLYRMNELGRDYAATYAIGSSPTPFQPLAADRDSATRLLLDVPADSDLSSHRLAAFACTASSGCDRSVRVDALLRSDPGNAYGWTQQLKLHSLAGDEAAVAADLHQVARSARYDDGEAAIRAMAFAAVSRLAPGDAAAMAGVARRLAGAGPMDSEDFRHGLRFLCSIAPPGASAWLRAHPESLADCRAAAKLLANSKSARASDWGWRWLALERWTPETRAGLDAATVRLARDSWDLGVTRLDGNRWRPWSDAEWQAWALARIDEARR